MVKQYESVILRQDALHRFAAMLLPLDADKRDLLVLRFAAGLTSAEIAAVVGKRDAAVRAQLSRALKTLKEHYHAE